MISKLKWFFLFLHLLGGYAGFSQGFFVLKGVVKTSNDSSLDIGDVLLFKAGETKIFKFVYVKDGSFSFKDLPQGFYELDVVVLGYKSFRKSIELNRDMSVEILLEKEAVGLDELVITGKKKIFDNKNGNLGVNVENSLLSAEPNAISLLQKLPGIQVSPTQEDISYLGKGEVLIYLGNQKISIEELNNISVANIQRIEIIKNPPAKYEANGRILILITPKKAREDGYEVTLKETVDLRRNLSNYAGINLNAKLDKLEINSNIDYNRIRQWEGNAFNYHIEDIDLKSGFNVEATTVRPEVKGGLGLHYQINEGDYISMNSNLGLRSDDDNLRALSFLEKGQLKENIDTNNLSEDSRKLITGNVNYNKKLEKIKGNLFFGAQYSLFKNVSDQKITDRSSIHGISYMHIQQAYDVNSSSAVIDAEKWLGKNWKMEAGSKLVSARALTSFNLEKNAIHEKSLYNFKEKNYAGYVALSVKVKKADINLGLRSETTDIDGGFENAQQNVVDSTYTNLFPKASFSIVLDSAKTIAFNYARTINRPNYSSFSQSIVYINPYVVFQRNINLIPAITNEVSATLQLKGPVLEISLAETRNPFYYLAIYDESNSLFTMSLQNVELEKSLTLALTYPLEFKKWSTYNYLAGYYSIIKDPLGVLGDSKPFLHFTTNNEFTLPEGYSFTLSGWVTTKRFEGMYERDANYAVNAGLSKTFFNRIKCSLITNDVFNTLKYPERFVFKNVASDGVWFTNFRGVALTVKYSFGKMGTSMFKNKAIENENRLN